MDNGKFYESQGSDLCHSYINVMQGKFRTDDKLYLKVGVPTFLKNVPTNFQIRSI